MEADHLQTGQSDLRPPSRFPAVPHYLPKGTDSLVCPSTPCVATLAAALNQLGLLQGFKQSGLVVRGGGGGG